MVKVGDFTVQLVRADTKEAFKEHVSKAPGHPVYAEVEPGVDYFVSVSCSRQGGAKVSLKIDGASIGYDKNWSKPFNSKYMGSWQRRGGISTTTALRFSAVAVRGKREGDNETANDMMTGKVEAAFFELGEKTQKVMKDASSNEVVSHAKVGGKKCVVSTTGTHTMQKQKKKSKGFSYKRGRHLSTVTIHYCTAVGLIVNKILDAPPPEGGEEATNDSQPDPVTSASQVKPEGVKSNYQKQKKRSIRGEESSVEKKPKAEAMIDLTGDDTRGSSFFMYGSVTMRCT